MQLIELVQQENQIGIKYHLRIDRGPIVTDHQTKTLRREIINADLSISSSGLITGISSPLAGV